MSPICGSAVVKVWGLTLDQINQLTYAGLQWGATLNTLIVSAGDGTGMAQVFSGEIVDAFPQIEQPQAPMIFSATGGTVITLKPMAPSSYSGPTDAATVLQNLASQAGLGFENGGVTAQLASPYFPGTIGQQIASASYAAGAYAFIDTNKSVLAAWPKTGSRAGSPTLISPETDMIGYPHFQQNKVVVRTLFNPSLVYGRKVQIQSQLTAACGMFIIVGCDHHISSLLPDGPWESVVTCVPQLGETPS